MASPAVSNWVATPMMSGRSLLTDVLGRVENAEAKVKSNQDFEFNKEDKSHLACSHFQVPNSHRHPPPPQIPPHPSNFPYQIFWPPPPHSSQFSELRMQRSCWNINRTQMGFGTASGFFMSSCEVFMSEDKSSSQEDGILYLNSFPWLNKSFSWQYFA